MAENYKFVNYAGAEMAELFDKIADLDVATQSKAGLMSDTDKTKLDNLPAGAQVNVLEGVQLAGTDLSISDKKVNIPVDNAPTEGSSALIRSGAVFSALAGVHQFRVVIVTELPASGEELVLYLVGPTGTGPDQYEEYLWNNNAWVKIGDTSLDISGKADKDTDAVAGNLAEFDANGNPVDSGIAKEKIAEIEGKVTELGNSVGISEGIADSTSAGTAQEIVFRQSGGDGVNYVKRFKGRTLVWNQLIPNNKKSFTVAAGETNDFVSGSPATIGHKYLLLINQSVTLVSNTRNTFRIGAQYQNTSENYSLQSGLKYWIAIAQNSMSFAFWSNNPDKDVTYDNFQAIDLTLLYGTEIDGLTGEQILAKYEADFGTGYHEYNAGTLISNDAEELETVGFNQWDEEWENGYLANNGTPQSDATSIRSKNFNPCFPGVSYYSKSFTGGKICFYNADKTFITLVYPGNNIFTSPSNAAYFKISAYQYGTTYKNDICINLSDASKNGTYEPYWKRTLNLGLNSFKVKDGQGNVITITGGLKSAGSVKDEIVGNKYIKRIGRADLGKLDWTYESSHGTMYAPYPSDAKNASSSTAVANILCAKYETKNYNSVYNGTIGIAFTGQANRHVSVYDSAYTDETTFKTAMSGVMLYYELATPIEYELAEPMPNAILVDGLGTERAVFPEHEDRSPSAPLCTDSNYSISVKNLVARLNE